VICRICAVPLVPWAVKDAIPLLKCPACGSIHADCTKPSGDLYAGLYRRDEPVPDVVAKSLDAVVHSMGRFRTHGKWLDVGFGQGALLEAATRGGWLSHGTELSTIALEKGHSRGFVTASGTTAFENGAFDVVSLVELLEHVEEPDAFLREARRVLRKGGCLYVTTPNCWSLNRWLLGPAWSVFSPPDHITIFPPMALNRLLSACGFQMVDLRADGLNPFEILQRRRSGQESAFDAANAGPRLCAAVSSTPGRARLKALANALLGATRLGDSLKARAI